MGKLIKIEVGTKFNRLTYLRNSESVNKRRLCVFLCDCGKEVVCRHDMVKSNHTSSCGCLNAETRSIKTTIRNTKHGKSIRNSQERLIYNVFYNMKKRCYDPENIRYKNYGGRGIFICEEWLKDISVFVDWALNNGYSKCLQIDRKNNDGNYEPNNCRFVTGKQNARNKSNNRAYLYKGEKLCISEISEKYCIKRGTLRSRLDYHKWSIEKSIEEPVKNAKKSKL